MMELMISLTMLAVIMAAAFPLVDGLMSRFQMARDHTVAASLCQARIERARGLAYGERMLMAEDGMLVDDYGNLANPGGRFRRTTEVALDTPAAGLATMRVRVQICSCTRGGWRVRFHPIREGERLCRFSQEGEEMSVIFTVYDQ